MNSPFNAYEDAYFQAGFKKKKKHNKENHPLDEVFAVRFHAIIQLPALAEKKASNRILALWQ